MSVLNYGFKNPLSAWLEYRGITTPLRLHPFTSASVDTAERINMVPLTPTAKIY